VIGMKLALGIVRWCKIHLIVSTLIALVILCALYEFLSTKFVYSRDGYITTDVIGLAPEVSGPLAVLVVKDNQIVHAGDLLLKINPEPFRLDLDRVEASYELAKASAQKANDEVAIASDRIAKQQAQLDDAKIAFERATELRQSGAVSQQILDDARRGYDVATYQLEAARTSRIAAEQEVAVQSASVYGAKAAVARAQYDLDRTVIVAPISGRIAPLIVRVGDYLTAGRPVVAIISDENWRLVVNLPERLLRGLKVGQTVLCYIGSDPGKIHKGTVRSIAPGVARSLDPTQVLPYVELTTDWIRLPRRFPVEIDLGDLPKRQRLFVGSDANIFYIAQP
jgi:membrane fusion protein, multidrug efflux system